ncbi:MAG: hypothetical protein HeimC3_30430 [Candidatus Heimdallarchaeota archaeon LC_3]|nr:MAG: hypothetical protein HeimC3_30430 [Candidatus Heimdallarchaeota archaeon LC_3]
MRKQTFFLFFLTILIVQTNISSSTTPVLKPHLWPNSFEFTESPNIIKATLHDESEEFVVFYNITSDLLNFSTKESKILPEIVAEEKNFIIQYNETTNTFKVSYNAEKNIYPSINFTNWELPLNVTFLAGIWGSITLQRVYIFLTESFENGTNIDLYYVLSEQNGILIIYKHPINEIFNNNYVFTSDDTRNFNDTDIYISDSLKIVRINLPFTIDYTGEELLSYNESHIYFYENILLKNFYRVYKDKILVTNWNKIEIFQYNGYKEFSKNFTREELVSFLELDQIHTSPSPIESTFIIMTLITLFRLNMRKKSKKN